MESREEERDEEDGAVDGTGLVGDTDKDETDEAEDRRGE